MIKLHDFTFSLKTEWYICVNKTNCIPLQNDCSGFSAVGSAHVWGARGRWFESSNPDSIYNERKDELHLSFFLFSRCKSSTFTFYFLCFFHLKAMILRPISYLNATKRAFFHLHFSWTFKTRRAIFKKEQQSKNDLFLPV